MISNYDLFDFNFMSLLFLLIVNPPTPAFAKAGAAPGTTAGVELFLLSFPRSNHIA